MDIPAFSHRTQPHPGVFPPAGRQLFAGRRIVRTDGGVQPCTVTLRSGGEAHTLPAADILFAEIFDHELHIHTVDGRTLCGRGHLSALERQLAGRAFLRCHKSYLVNLQFVTGLCRYRITLTGGAAVPVSKQNYLAIQQAIDAYELQRKADHACTENH